MDLAIVGAGNVGGALGRSWARVGHRILYGVREPGADKSRALAAATGGGAEAVTPRAAAAAATVVVLATPWAAVPEAIASAGDLSGRVVIDCTNPLRFTPGTGLELALGFSDSGAETVARLAPGARVVKAFNTYGWENFADACYPNAAGLKPLMFHAGDDAAAKEVVATLAAEIGFEPFDAGHLRAARELEPLGLLWIRRALSAGRGPDFTWARLAR
jgi:hypothetical protein